MIGRWAASATSPAPFDNPSGVEVDAVFGNVYVADTDAGRIAVFDTALRSIANITAGGFGAPRGPAVDGYSGTVYVADTAGNRIVVLKPEWTFGVAGTEHGQTLAVNMSAGRVQDSTGNDNAASNTVSLTIDRSAPEPVITSVQRSPTNATTISFRVAWSLDVTEFTRDDITLDGDAAPGSVTNFVMVRGDLYTFDVVTVSDGTVQVGIAPGAAEDRAGNPSAEADPVRVVRDTERPTPLITAVQSSPTGAPTINLRVHWEDGDAVTGFTADNVTLSGDALHGGITNFVMVRGDLYTFDVSPTADGTVQVDIAENATRDLAGNPSEAAARFSITYHGMPLVPTITPVRSGSTNLQTVPFYIEFSRVVDAATLDASDIEATSGTVSDPHPVWKFKDNFGGFGPQNGRFQNPAGIAIDSGRIYVADWNNNRIQVFDSDRRYITEIKNGFDTPYDVAVNGSGHVFVADTNNNRIQVFDPAYRNITDITGFTFPFSVAVNGSGHIFVSDSTPATASRCSTPPGETSRRSPATLTARMT